MRVELWTYGYQRIGTVEIPLFEKLPAVLVWGSRAFVLDSETSAATDNGIPIYHEGRAFVVDGGLL